MADVTQDLGGPIELHLGGIDAAGDLAGDTHQLAVKVAGDLAGFAENDRRSADIALDHTIDLQLAHTLEVTQDPQILAEYRRNATGGGCRRAFRRGGLFLSGTRLRFRRGPF